MFDRNRLLAHGATRIPGLKRLPIFKLLAIGELAILANHHMRRLNDQERHRLFELIKTSRGRSGNLTEAERKDFAALVAKMEPRLFAGLAADKLSPFPLPKRFTQGPKHERERRAQEQRGREQRDQQQNASTA
jgi:hypothetical protein